MTVALVCYVGVLALLLLWQPGNPALNLSFMTDGKLTIKIGEETSNATYTFSGKDTVEVTYEDGTVDSFQLIPTEHDGVNQIQFMNTNTNYTLTLEPMSSWVD